MIPLFLCSENNDLYDTLTPIEYLRFIGILYGKNEKEIEKKALKMLEIFELSQNKDSIMTTFSKGMKQKVLIMAGMIHNPDIIFLDEPLSGVDSNTVLLTKKILAKLATKGKTIIYCSHILEIVERISDRIIIIDNGKVIANDSFEKLKTMDKGNSLEQIFSQLTSESKYFSLADQLLDAVIG